MGCSSEHLQVVFDTVAKDLEHWEPPQVAIADEDQLHEHLGDKSYQHAFLEFFDRRLTDFKGEWNALVTHYLVDSDKPLLSGTVGGFGHPLILFADAFELASPKLAVEALALTAVDYTRCT